LVVEVVVQKLLHQVIVVMPVVQVVGQCILVQVVPEHQVKVMQVVLVGQDLLSAALHGVPVEVVVLAQSAELLQQLLVV
jgi:hypothetical protein